MSVRHLITASDFSRDELDKLLALARNIYNEPAAYADACKGRLMASLFFEPSTRTKFSFAAAMYRLGGTVMGFDDPATVSTAKGESLADTTRIVSSYADLIVTRSPREGAAALMSRFSTVPVINAGDGGHEHPTQTLTDLLTILQLKGRLTGLRIGVCGDLKFGRTIHSLISTLSRYEDNTFVFISAPELRIPEYVTASLPEETWRETASLDDEIASLDILYMTRVQRERFVSEDEYVRLKDNYILDNEKMGLAGQDLIVMHPLPRAGEIDPELDDDPRAVYFTQAAYGVYVRMALILTLLEAKEAKL